VVRATVFHDFLVATNAPTFVLKEGLSAFLRNQQPESALQGFPDGLEQRRARR
jgi:hypothetical protein